jgi:hypothetical protein
MDLNFEQLTAAALRLPSAERARVAEALIASLDLEDMGWDADWLAEAERRDRTSDAADVRPASEVLAEVRAALLAVASSDASVRP